MWKGVAIGCLAVLLLGSPITAAAGQPSHGADDPPAALPLQLEDLRGVSRSLADYRGSVVLVNFWASWCGPCVKEIPSLRELYRTLSGEPFEILAVNVKEGRFKVHKFSQMMAMPFPVLLDPEGEAFAAWDAQVLPTSFLIDAEGRVREEIHGPLDWASDEVLATIRALLPAPRPALTSADGAPNLVGPLAISGSPAD